MRNLFSSEIYDKTTTMKYNKKIFRCRYYEFRSIFQIVLGGYFFLNN